MNSLIFFILDARTYSESRSRLSPRRHHMRRSPQAGYEVVGACLDGGPSIVEVDGGAIPVLGRPVDALEVANGVDADTLAVAGTSAVGSRHLRELSWRMEGSGIQLMVAPALTDVGLKLAVTPDGNPDALKVIVWADPFVTAVEMFEVPLAP